MSGEVNDRRTASVGARVAMFHRSDQYVAVGTVEKEEDP